MTDAASARWWPPGGATGWRGLVLAGAAGLCIALGQAPFDLFWIALPGLVLAIFLGVSAPCAKHAFRRGFATGFFFAALTLQWIVEPFLVDLAAHGLMAPPAIIAMASGFGLFWAGAFWATHKGLPSSRPARFVLLAVFLSVSEMLRSYIFTGFPWALTSYIWIDTPVYQAAALIGPHGVTFLTLLGAAGVGLALSGRKAMGVLLAIISSANVLAFAAVGAFEIAPLVPDRPIVRLIQPNADQREKWDPQMMPVFYERQLTLTSEPSNLEPDLIIWPEVSVPFLLNDEGAPFWEIANSAGSATVILGAQRLDGPRAYNSLAVLGVDGSVDAIYDKKHLVPFGEYLPGEFFLSRLGLRAFTAKYGFGYSAGTGPALIDLGDLGRALPMICYEGIFPHELRRVDERPDWMLMITNDAWFGTFSGPWQHLAQARARAIETGLPMVRVANTGISAVIDAGGTIIASMDQGVAGRLDVALPTAKPATLYWKSGDIPVLLLLIVVGLGALAPRRA